MKEILCRGRQYVDIGYGLSEFKLSFETVKDGDLLRVNFSGSDETICTIPIDKDFDLSEEHVWDVSMWEITDATEKRKVRRKIRDYVLEHYLMIRL